MKEEEYEEEEEDDKKEEENNNKENENNNFNKGKLDENDIVNYNVNNSNNSYLNVNKNNNVNNANDRKLKEIKKEKKKFSLMFKNKLKDYELLSKKYDKLLNKVESKQKKQKDNNINNSSQDKKLLEKELQLKNSLAMIHNLTKENKKLKEELDTIKIKYFSNEEWQIITKNSEIEKLKKKNIELNKKYEIANFNKINYENILNQKDEIINRQKKKIFELKYKSENDKSSSINIHNISAKKNKNKTMPDFKTTTKNKLLKSYSQLDIKQLNNKCISLRKYINENHYNFLNDKEKSALKNLFGSDEDNNIFRAKYNTVENRNKRAENQLEKKIVNLETQLKEKENIIEELNKKLKEKESNIKVLENKIKEMNIRIKIAENKNKRIILSIEEQLKENGYNIDNLSDTDKMDKLNDLINHFKEELNKNYIEKQKEDEICKINQEIGNIQFFDDNFFKNYKTNNK